MATSRSNFGTLFLPRDSYGPFSFSETGCVSPGTPWIVALRSNAIVALGIDLEKPSERSDLASPLESLPPPQAASATAASAMRASPASRVRIRTRRISLDFEQ